jgi:alanyl-tRNA synthetase
MKDKPPVTERLYFQDVYRMQFQARVLERLDSGGFPAVVLDQTCFYPEGGGQPSDVGWLNDIPVKKVVEEQGKIIHTLDGEITGDEVEGKIDWEKRFDHMQQHAGQHILSQCFDELFQGRTMSFHLGEDVSTLEIGLSDLGEEQLFAVEEAANRAVFANVPIKAYFVEAEKIADVPLRKPPQKAGTIRVVEVAEFDYSACGGTHPHRTGEIGLIKILKKERIRGNLRFEFVCGRRALLNYARKNEILGQAAAAFSVGEADLMFSLQKLMAESKSQKQALKKLREQAARMEALELVNSEDAPIILRIFTEKTIPEMRLLALNLIRHPGKVVLFGLQAQPNVHLILARSEDLDIDLREIIPAVASEIQGKGGGRPSLVEMAGTHAPGLKSALDRAHQAVSAQLTSP